MDNKRSSSNRPRRSGGKYVTTRSGRNLKINRSLSERWTALREAKSRRRVERLIGLPKSRFKRFAWRLQPKKLAEYWFSRDGGIMALKIIGIAIVAFFILTMGVFAFFRKDLPNLDKDISGGSLGGSVSYYDRSGQNLLFQDYNAVKRVPVASNDISHYVKDASVAVEDRDFYKHRGFDVKGIARAAANDFFHRSSTQGGSTITQQLVKLTQDWTQQRSFTRKAKELILAVELERTYTKDQILTGYLNAAPYGGVDYGVQSAASDYFQKSAKDLTLPESAMLAAIPKSPSVYSPYNKENFDKKSFTDRYDYVLDSMVQTGKIKKAEAEAAKKVDVLAEVHPQQDKFAGIKSPYFVLAAKAEIDRKFVCTNNSGCAKIGGWKVITTMDPDLQAIAEQKVRDNLSNVRRYGADEEALVAEDVKTGQMMALVGGVDFNDPDHGHLNYASSVKVSPGSSFKPYDYSSLIENSNNVGAGSVLYDSQGAIPGYPCTNKAKPTFGKAPDNGANCLWDYDFRSPGPLSIRYALGGSRNIPAVKAMLTVGTSKTISTANALMNSDGEYKCYKGGVDVNQAKPSDEATCYGASAIGDGAYLHLDRHVNGLASLSRLGKSIPQTYILRIYKGAESKAFYEWKQPKDGDKNVKQAVRPDTAYILDDMASDPNASYLNAGFYKWHNYKGWKTAIKTGTTNNGFDGLMMAWNTKYAVGSWVGYHTRNKSLSTFMENLTMPLTRGFMTSALDRIKTPPVNWTAPSDIQHLPGFVVRTHVGLGSVEPSPATEIYPSWYKPKAGGASANTVIDKVSNKVATNCTPDAAKQTVGGDSSADHFSVDIFFGHGAAGANTTATDDVHSCSDTPPTVSLTASDNNDGTATLSAFVHAGTHPLNDAQYPQYPGTVTFYANGNVIGTKSVSDPEDNVSISYTATGSGTVNFSATVTDSVLFSGTDSKSLNLASAGAGPQNLHASVNGTNVDLQWTNGTAPFTYSSSGPGGIPKHAITCSSTGATSCRTSLGQAPHGSTVYVASGGSETSASVP